MQWTWRNKDFAAAVFKGEQLISKGPEWWAGGKMEEDFQRRGRKVGPCPAWL